MKKLFIFLLLLVGRPSGAQPATTNLKPLYHQFDFWLGEWEVYKSRIGPWCLTVSTAEAHAREAGVRLTGSG